MNKKQLIYTTILIGFIIINIIVYLITEKTLDSRVESVLNSHNKNLQTNYNLIVENKKKIADLAFEVTINDPEILEMIENRFTLTQEQQKTMRRKLQNKVQHIYDELKTNGALQYHFIYKNNYTLLRMHKPSKYNDDLTQIRKDVAYVNKRKERIYGFGEGKTSHGFKHIYPVFNKDGKHIGVIDIAFPSDVIQTELNKMSKIHTHFLVNKNIFSSKAWSRNDMELKYQDSDEHKDFKITISKYMNLESKKLDIHNSLELYQDKIAKNMAKEKPFNLFTYNGEKAEVISFVPVKHNLKNEIPAWIVSYDESRYLELSIEAVQQIRILAFILFSIIFYFFYRLVGQKEYLNKAVEEKTLQLQNINRELEESEQELHVINENLEERINEEVEKNREKDMVMAQQSKMASLGEMIENIAHQWRQPLSIISTSASGIQLQKEMGILEDKQHGEFLTRIIDTSEHLSRTIDDFRDFFKPDKEKDEFCVKDAYSTTSNIINSKFVNSDIKIIENIENVNYFGLKGELIQVLINILNNAKDALDTKRKTKKLIFVNIYKQDSWLIISIKDNAGGVPEEIMDKIFEPYFTTKHKAQGTGIGLYMSSEIIIKHMDGEFLTENVTYEYEGENYTGANFIIKLPL